MMLTPEQLAELREYVGNGSGFSGASGLLALLEHIDAQQARIAELEENAGAHALAMKAGKAMLEAETARADSAEKDAARLRAFATKVAQQTPEKPDYWSSCGQCANNASEAEDLIEVAPAVWPEDTSDYGSRIAVVGQNGNDGLHYGEGKP